MSVPRILIRTIIREGLVQQSGGSTDKNNNKRGIGATKWW
jgi:hypothetical protein